MHERSLTILLARSLRLSPLLLLPTHHPVLRGDIARLERCTAITTGGDRSPSLDELDDEERDTKTLEGLLPQTIKRSKPFKYTYEKEIVMYAYFKVRSTALPLLSGQRRARGTRRES